MSILLQRHAFGRADRLLAIQLWFERALAPLHDIQQLHQAMPDHLRPGGGRIVLAQTSHLLAAYLMDRGVVANQVPSHDGCGRTTTARRERGALASLLGLDERGDLGVEALAPGLSNLGRGPGCDGEKATEAGEGGLDGNMAQQSREGLGFLTEQQGHQDDLEGAVLRLAEARAKRCGELAQPGIHP